MGNSSAKGQRGHNPSGVGGAGLPFRRRVGGTALEYKGVSVKVIFKFVFILFHKN
jgi:hypothetical protein